MEQLALQAAQELLPRLRRPFMFFGHSMGALLAFEVARLLRRNGQPQPTHLLVSGAKAPQCWVREVTYHLPDKDFIEVVRNLNGTPPEILAHPEVLDAILPILRADFAVCETYQYEEQPPLTCPIIAYGGSDDAGVPLDSLTAWKVQTTSQFAYYLLSGGHFFLRSNAESLVQLVAASLKSSLSPAC